MSRPTCQLSWILLACGVYFCIAMHYSLFGSSRVSVSSVSGNSSDLVGGRSCVFRRRRRIMRGAGCILKKNSFIIATAYSICPIHTQHQMSRECVRVCFSPWPMVRSGLLTSGWECKSCLLLISHPHSHYQRLRPTSGRWQII